MTNRRIKIIKGPLGPMVLLIDATLDDVISTGMSQLFKSMGAGVKTREELDAAIGEEKAKPLRLTQRLLFDNDLSGGHQNRKGGKQ